MKRLLLFVFLTISGTIVYGQKSIDALFDRYAGRDGFVTVTINEIRILAQEDENLKVENFYDMVIKDINLDLYEEFMRVKGSEQDLRMLVRSEGKKFKEFLLIAGGEDNALIQIKGNMTYDEAKKFSSDAKKNHGMNLIADHK
jgi:hypothetical protein